MFMLFFLGEGEGWNNSMQLRAKNINKKNLNPSLHWNTREEECWRKLHRFYMIAKRNANEAVNKMKLNVAKVKASALTSLLFILEASPFSTLYFRDGYCAEAKKRQPYKHRAWLWASQGESGSTKIKVAWFQKLNCSSEGAGWRQGSCYSLCC